MPLRLNRILRCIPWTRRIQGRPSRATVGIERHPRYSLRIGERADAYGWDLTAEAVSWLSDAARQNGLTVSEKGIGSRQSSVVQIEIRR